MRADVKARGKPKRRTARGAMIFGYARKEDDPSWQAAQRIKGDLEHGPCCAGPVRTLEDMGETEILALESRYSCPVRRPICQKKS